VANRVADANGVRAGIDAVAISVHAERFNTKIIIDLMPTTSASAVHTSPATAVPHLRSPSFPQAHQRSTGLPSESASWVGSRGVPPATVFFTEQEVCVIGGGNTAVEEVSAVLVNIASKVTLCTAAKILKLKPS
jgi:thioredoxin reductase